MMSNFKTILISFIVGAIVYAVFGKKIAEMIVKKKPQEDINDDELKTTN